MNLEKLLRSAIKIAAVALTAPATWAVAGNLYDSPIQRVIVQLAALVLVEAALLLGWHMLDNSSSATSAQRMLYAVLTVTAYGVLWTVAIAHGEGLAGIGFRATLGVLIGYSVIESGLLAGVKLRQQADRDITRHRAVKRHRRKLAIDDAYTEFIGTFADGNPRNAAGSCDSPGNGTGQIAVLQRRLYFGFQFRKCFIREISGIFLYPNPLAFSFFICFVELSHFYNSL